MVVINAEVVAASSAAAAAVAAARSFSILIAMHSMIDCISPSLLHSPSPWLLLGRSLDGAFAFLLRLFVGPAASLLTFEV